MSSCCSFSSSFSTWYRSYSKSREVSSDSSSASRYCRTAESFEWKFEFFRGARRALDVWYPVLGDWCVEFCPATPPNWKCLFENLEVSSYLDGCPVILGIFRVDTADGCWS